MQNKQIKIAASIIGGDFAHLGEEAQRIEQSGADYLHIDIMDGNFVPNITMGPQAVAAINRSTKMFLDVHLMIYNPFDYIERFVEAGADSITFHFEATEAVDDTLRYIKKCGARTGLAFNPETSFGLIPRYLDKCDMMLLMTVHPGFGGQEFIPDVIDKINLTRDACDKLNINLDIEVDGGINDLTAKECVEAGANVLVSGSYLFHQPDLKIGVQKIRQAATLR